MTSDVATRASEWFVPKFGPKSFRMIVGLLYLPYTGMCISFVIIGGLLAEHVYWDRLVSIVIIYFLGLGVSAHAADAMGSKAKPWGTFFTKIQLKALIIVPLTVAYGIGLYYIIFYVPLLGVFAIVEGLLLFAYNFELLSGRFHNNLWFSFGWGTIPVLAGYVIQAGRLDVYVLNVSALATITSYAEIRLSRHYKKLKGEQMDNQVTSVLERRLKILSISTLSIALLFLVARAISN